MWSNKFEKHGSKQRDKGFTTRPLEAFKMLTCIVSSKEKRENVCVFPELTSLEASHGTNVAKNILENIGLEIFVSPHEGGTIHWRNQGDS